MPKLFELFGYPLADNSEEAKRARRTARCCFMGRECDGGGNRYSSSMKLANHPRLRDVLTLPAGVEVVPSGVCSIKVQPNERPWIVCPRRLMALSRSAERPKNTFQATTETRLLSLLGYPAGTRLGVWAEVNLDYKEEVEGQQKKFDYAFDYILSPMGRASQTAIEAATGERWNYLRRRLHNHGYTISQRDGETFVEDFPVGKPSVIEIMTCSTSGGNKEKRTTISNAFEDAMLGRGHNAPGINYRQVWARMVSQLIVKTEVALHWGGPALWIVQDVLVDYICSSTALDIRRFLAENWRSKHAEPVLR